MYIIQYNHRYAVITTNPETLVRFDPIAISGIILSMLLITVYYFMTHQSLVLDKICQAFWMMTTLDLAAGNVCHEKDTRGINLWVPPIVSVILFQCIVAMTLPCILMMRS